jgi:hypothetical protein
MANTFTIIAQTTTTSNVSSILFTSIDQNYDTLMIYYSLKTNYNNPDDDASVAFNSSIASYYRVGVSSGSGIAYPTSSSSLWIKCAGNSVANAFGTGELIINRYASSSTLKRTGLQSAASGTTSTSQLLLAGSWNENAAITDIELTANNSTFTSGCSVYLYGVNDIV